MKGFIASKLVEVHYMDKDERRFQKKAKTKKKFNPKYKNSMKSQSKKNTVPKSLAVKV